MQPIFLMLLDLDAPYNRDTPTWMTLAKAIMLSTSKAEFRPGQEAVSALKRYVCKHFHYTKS